MENFRKENAIAYQKLCHFKEPFNLANKNEEEYGDGIHPKRKCSQKDENNFQKGKKPGKQSKNKGKKEKLQKQKNTNNNQNKAAFNIPNVQNDNDKMSKKGFPKEGENERKIHDFREPDKRDSKIGNNLTNSDDYQKVEPYGGNPPDGLRYCQSNNSSLSQTHNPDLDNCCKDIGKIFLYFK